ncbi:MAG: hypothetical protein EOS55_31385 [Mesorhizobium sp.]|nr:MAG: hypothetical protein EOS55_31385 [Mesorhizobium sp.]
MREGETEIEMVRRHVRDGAAIVVRQHELVGRLQANGLATQAAEQMLAQFEGAQRQHQEHLDRLEAAQIAGF